MKQTDQFSNNHTRVNKKTWKSNEYQLTQRNLQTIQHGGGGATIIHPKITFFNGVCKLFFTGV